MHRSTAPWYDDSNPQGTGWTREEAVADALNELNRWYDQIGAFLAITLLKEQADDEASEAAGPGEDLQGQANTDRDPS